VRTFRRSAVLVLCTAAIVVAGASVASAAITLREDGASIVLEDASLSNDTLLSFTAPDTYTVQNRDGSGFGILLYSGGVCHFSPTDNDAAECPASAFNDIKATYGGGNDSFRFYGSCIPTTTINLGEGTNGFTGEDCTGATATVTGGSGQETFNGGEAAETFFGGGGDDELKAYGGDDEIHGGEGNDVLDGGTGNDGLFGDGGSDQIAGRAGNDTENGGPGDDKMGQSDAYCCTEDKDSGADDVRGGDGADSLTLEDHEGGMAISLDDAANDGSSGEGDNIHSDLERVYGTSANDVFIGTSNADDFSGNSGNDEIHGGGGGDLLTGDSGDDTLFGDAGDDKVQGREGADVVDGGSGRDQLYGDRDSCTYSCTYDPDQIFARDGELDTVDCGGGADRAQVDGLDVVAFCTSVDRQNLPGAGGGGGGPSGGSNPGTALALQVGASIKLKALLKKGLVVRLKCARACKVAGTLSYKGKKLGSGRKTLAKAGKVKFAVRIGKKARAKVRRLRGKKLTLRVKVTSAGKTTTLTRKVKLKR
jgi:Ca2+-binding RTX toxin-like protein